MLRALMPSTLDARTRRALNAAARRLNGLYEDLLKLHAMGAGIADTVEREIYAASLRQLLDQMASANRTLEELAKRNRSAAP